MCIYTSTRVMPYVYKLTHSLSGHFYIGYRKANKLPSDQDIIVYKSSSKLVKSMEFENFKWEIIAEFFNEDYAYDFEQQMIFESLENNLCLNMSCFTDGKRRFKRSGPLSEEHKQKIKYRLHDPIINNKLKSMLGKRHTDVSKRKMSEKSKASRTPEVLKKISEAQKGRKLSDDHKRKLSEAAKRQFEDPEQRKIASENAKKRVYSEETRAKMKESSAKRNLTPELRDKFRTAKDVWTGRHHSEESRNKISESKKGKESTFKGNTHSEESKRNMSNGRKGIIPKQTIVTCPHCGKSGASTIINRYHFDKCKHKPTES